jgi:hypothetical protein
MTGEQMAAVKKALMSPEGRQKLAESMVVPVRCGGCHYDENGKAWLLLGGWWVPQSVTSTHPNPWPAIHEYQRTHEKDPHGWSRTKPRGG